MNKIDIKILKIMIISGANNLYNHHFEIDKLNVFPIPDGDTGTNMNLTIMNGIKEIKNKKISNLQLFANYFSKGLMMGARGNSGVILSQIFRGFFQNIKNQNFNKNFISNKDLLKYWKDAQNYAYHAVINPVEGTILTVIKDGVNYINQLKIQEKDSIYIFEKLLEGMKKSLKKTPSLLPILKKSGVVDSGGSGLIYIIEGMLYGLKYGKIIVKSKNFKNIYTSKLKIILNKNKFGYCTEIILKIKKINNFNFNITKIKKDLKKENSKSIVIINDDNLIKIHIHTLKPGQILNYFQKYGEFLKINITNMTEQVKTHIQTIQNIRKLNNQFALITAVPGLGIKKYFKYELNINYIMMYSQKKYPSINKFLQVIEKVDAKIIYILPNDNNLLLIAKKVKKIEKKSKIFVLPTKNIAQGMRAALNFNSELSYKENKKNMKNEIKNVSFGYIKTTNHDIQIKNLKIQKNNHFCVISPRNKNGKEKIIYSNINIFNTIKYLLNKLIWNNAEIITIFKGKNYLEEQIIFIKKILSENYDIQYEIIDGKQKINNFSFIVE